MDFKNTIGITGASGFLGSYLCQRLPFPQKRLSRQPQVNHDPHVHWVLGNLENRADTQTFVQHTPTLIHLACQGYPQKSNQTLTHDIQHNLLPSIQLFEAFAQTNPNGHLVFSSTGGNMYDASHPENLHTEDSVPCPQSSYSIHKLTEEHSLRLLCKKYGIKATILRISNPYGILLPKERGQGIIGVALNKTIQREPLSIFDSLKSVRDYIHLEDVASAFRLALENPPYAGECRLFHVSSGIGHSLEDILNLIQEKTGHTLVQKPHSLIPDPSYSVLSYQKIKSVLGWTPQVSLEKGLEQMISQTSHYATVGPNG